MELTLKVYINGQYGDFYAAKKIPELYRKEFETLRTCDEPLMAMVTGEVMEKEAKIVIKARKDASEILAKELTKFIIKAMERNDTHNGY